MMVMLLKLWIVSWIFKIDFIFTHMLVVSWISFFFNRQSVILCCACIHTYLVVTSLLSELRYTFRHNYVVWVNFINKWRDVQFKVDSEWQILFGKLFHGIFLFSHMVCSFLQRKCHSLTRCIQKIADQPRYNVIFY